LVADIQVGCARLVSYDDKQVDIEVYDEIASNEYDYWWVFSAVTIFFHNGELAHTFADDEHMKDNILD